ncbi:MAG: diacylglycerol/lipid kinase family protein [Acidimicrobiia bacterium]
MEWTALLNPNAGGRRFAAIRDALAARRDVECCESHSAAEALDYARAAVAAGRSLIACGGDGTFGIAATAATNTSAVVTVIPNGTGNDMARALGTRSREGAPALALLDRGWVASIDMGRIVDATGAESLFPSVVSIGLDAAANARAESTRWLHGSLRYPVSALSALRSFRPFTVELVLDDGTPELRRAWMVAVANTPNYAGGMKIAPNAHMNDGLFDIVTVGPIARLDLVRNLPKVYRGNHTHHPAVTMRRAREVRITAFGATPLSCRASGEEIGPLPISVTCLASALKVVVPPQHPLATTPLHQYESHA